MTRNTFAGAALTALAALLPGCNLTLDDLNKNLDTVCNDKGVCTSLKAFGNSVEQQMTAANAVGWAWAVSGPGLANTGASGMARTAADSPERPFDQDTTLDVASVSKVITGVAVLQALHQTGHTVDTKISGYLPPDWKPGANVDTITFKELLTHSSGFRAGGNAVDYASLKTMVEGGVTLADKQQYAYVNANFALFRVILPYLTGFTDPGAAERDAATSAAYVKYVQEHVWKPLGRTVDTKSALTQPTLIYPTNPGATHGIDFKDTTLISGGRGWYASTADLWNLLRSLHYSETLLDAPQRTQMEQGLLGFDDGQVSDGHYPHHNGYLWVPVDNNGGVASINSEVAILPTGAVAVLISNSPADVTGIVAKAYEDSRSVKK